VDRVAVKREGATIAERYRAIVARVAAAASRAGRSPAETTIVVAAKTFGAEALRAVAEAGARDIGENYVQEAVRKAAATGLPGIRWHMIGRLQRNKVKQALRLFDLIHSVDRVELARDLDSCAAAIGVTARCLVEVNLGGEPSKGGVPVDSLRRFFDATAAFSRLEIRGLTAIPPPGTFDESRRRFAELRSLRDDLGDLRLPHVQLKELSMGMSADFEAAVEEGATFVRIGTAIFGPRAT
jgi:pyridoxal phosphate enzyme (YggS family)